MNIMHMIRGAAGLAVLLLLGCSASDSNNTVPVSTNTAPTVNASALVYRDATLAIDVDTDVVYAQGLSHSYWNAPNPVTMDLLLDVYEPMNDAMARPAMVFIHGGGFIGGDKGTEPAVEFARYFAERGFVALSINYRLLGNYGTLPQSVIDAVDGLALLSDAERDQAKAMYPAVRDAKAAIRWLAANAAQYNVDPNRISVIGGSAGSFISIALGATDFADYKDELSLADDPTLASTHLDDDVIVASVVDHWGGTASVDLLESVDGNTRWSQSDAPISIVHGTEDPTVSYQEAEALVDIYTSTGAYYELITLEGAGHGAWNVTYNGQPLETLGFDFVTRMLDIEVQ
ncbi:MAG: alpha/beta hydrolase fold domain-containing protein [Pseudomonadota bacterium]